MSVPTAEEFLKSKGLFNDKSIRLSNIGMTTSEAMIEFAKMHVTAALKEVIDNIEVSIGGDGSPLFSITSILNSYPLENIR